MRVLEKCGYQREAIFERRGAKKAEATSIFTISRCTGNSPIAHNRATCREYSQIGITAGNGSPSLIGKSVDGIAQHSVADCGQFDFI